MTTTWPRLRGKTYSLIGRTVRATIHLEDGSTVHIRRAPGLWRVDDTDGTMLRLTNDVGDYFREADGTMRLQPRRRGSFRMYFNDVEEGSKRLIEPYAIWDASRVDNGEAPVPQRIEQTLVRGRAGWRLDFGPVIYVVDDETGIGLSYSSPKSSAELSDPVLDEDFSDEVFTWDGPTEDVECDRIPRPVPEHKRRLHVMPLSLPGWMPLSVQGSHIKGDPDTGALEIMASAQIGAVVRRWPTALPEPPCATSRHFTVVARREDGPWTVEVRLPEGSDSSDAAAVVESIHDLPPLPNGSA